jgi:hypothetical protein
LIVDRLPVALEVLSALACERREVANFGVKVSVKVLETPFIGVIRLLRVT